jgi:ribosomal-protein-alanine N-acetyltransferase
MLREATTADFDVLWRIDQECFVRGISYSREELRTYMRRSRAFTLVEEDDKEICGFLVGEGSARGTGHIITIDVVPGVRRSGVGSRLLAAAEAKLVTAGCDGVLLEVAVDNASAIHFYNRHGYTVLKVLPRYYLGQLDGLLMGKRLAGAVAPKKKASR